MNRDSGTSFFTVVFVLFAVLGILYLMKGLLLLFILPFLFAYLFNPFVNAMERRGIARGMGTLLIFLTLSIALSAAVMLLWKPAAAQAGALHSNMDVYGKKIETWFGRIEENLGFKDLKGEKVPGQEKTGLHARWLKKAAGILPGVFFGVFGSLVSLITVVPLITFFLVRDGRNIRRSIISLVPNRYFERTLVLQYEINRQIGRYLRGELTRSIIVGSMIAAGLWIVDGPYPILMGVFAGVTNVIPFIGPYVGAAPALLIVLFSGSGPEGTVFISVVSVALVYIVSQLLDMICINPVVLGKSVELHPLIIVLSLLIGVEFLGIIGMVLAVPVSSILKVVFVQLYQSKRRIDPTGPALPE